MKQQKRQYKHIRVRNRIKGTVDRPRIAVFRSNAYIYAQLIDDLAGKTLAFESDRSLKGAKKEKAFLTGEKLAKKALDLKIKQIVFDRGGFLYHGRVAALAEGLRKGGLEF